MQPARPRRLQGRRVKPRRPHDSYSSPCSPDLMRLRSEFPSSNLGAEGGLHRKVPALNPAMPIALGAGQHALELLDERLSPLRIGSAMTPLSSVLATAPTSLTTSTTVRIT